MSDPLEEVQKTWIRGACYGCLDDIPTEDELRKAEVGARYYLHHHRPPGKRKHLVSENSNLDAILTSTRDLKEILENAEREIAKPSTLKRAKSTAKLVRLKVCRKGKTKIHIGAEIKVPSGHVLTSATCSSYTGVCETCRHTVYRTRYLYCKNCPVVVHDGNKCRGKLKNKCPAPELGIFGWGEGKAEAKKMLRQVFDLDDVLLSGPVNENTCGGCGRVLIPERGHACGPVEEVQKPESLQKDKRLSIRSLREGVQNLMNGKLKNGDDIDHAKKVRTCFFTKKLYCEKCHWNDMWYIPAHMLLLNDYTKKPVCRSAYLKLRVLWDTAVVAIPEDWHKESEAASRLFTARQKLKSMSHYIKVCTTAQSMRKLLDDLHAPHLIECATLLRMVDLCYVVEGNLYGRLTDIEESFENHIRECLTCKSVNRLCCVCGQGKPLFYYADDVLICRDCGLPYHIECKKEKEAKHRC
ncbi:hypothetical protein Aperf_G00000008350 [Anoplocephala perfoliata]